VVLARRLGGRWAVAAAMAWGLAWIAVGRLTDEPRSPLVGLAAVAAAVVVLVATGRQHARIGD
jgi:drug/metabolite transporter (DMT)-like permease